MAKTEKTHKQATLASQGVTLQDLGLDLSQKKHLTTAFSLWVRALMQNWRQGTVACKGRSDVARSNKKPWKQKGTGRARAGSARSPLWRGGGVIFGPQARTRTLAVPRKQKQGVLNSLLFDFVERGNVRLLDWSPAQDMPKTALAHQLLRTNQLHDKKVTLFVPVDDVVTYASFANIPNVKVLFFDQANAFDLASSDCWAVCKKDFDYFKEMASQWI